VTTGATFKLSHLKCTQFTIDNDEARDDRFFDIIIL